ncbi:SigB/SigF/SigG family RNA polymerase sigma factor [Nonomuraea recticatena]|uniref:SigB/SigF/SigG family RNA polymerase sigma factor n=1 Tax=Nonomuraea recticatena TaxID=46178 RepID=UPI00360D4E7D
MFERLASLSAGHPRRDWLRQELARRHQGLVETLARRFKCRGEPVEDLIQSGNVGLVKAIDRFDVRRGNTFIGYAVPVILGEIRRHFRDMGWAVHVPRRVQNLKVVTHLAVEHLTQELGRRPTSQELADHLGLDLADVTEGLRADAVYSCLSLDVILSEENCRPEPSDGQDDEGIELVIDRQSLWPLLGALPDRERTVLLLRFFGNQTQSEIAQHLGVSQAHVSRLEAKACSQLRDQLRAA